MRFHLSNPSIQGFAFVTHVVSEQLQGLDEPLTRRQLDRLKAQRHEMLTDVLCVKTYHTDAATMLMQVLCSGSHERLGSS